VGTINPHTAHYGKQEHEVRFTRWLFPLIVIWSNASPVLAQPYRICTARELRLTQQKLHGSFLDFTFNHGVDNRIYSPALEMKRDLYVYLPPGFDEKMRYPVMIFLHGVGQDEKNFLETVLLFDKAIQCGKLPRMIIVAPDGSISGRASIRNGGSFYINSEAGRFEDWIEVDVWNFVTSHFPIRPEREAHIIGGASMGGFGAYNHAIKFRHRYSIVFGVLPPMNLRYSDCHGEYFANYDPNCVMFRNDITRKEPIARFCGILVLRQRQFLDPLFGRRSTSIDQLARENPIEMLSAYGVQPGELSMYAAYGTKDEFNIDAQVEHFIDVAVKQGLTITVQKIINGRHDTDSGRLVFPDMVEWVRQSLESHGVTGPVPGE